MVNQVDQAILGNPDFLPAFKRLTCMLSTDYAMLLLDAAKAYFEALQVDDPRSPFDAMSAAVAAPFVIALLNVTWGTPLYMTDALLDAWAGSDGTVAECGRCGYRHPAGIAVCVLCGSATGEAGIFARTRAAVARLN